jgi:hypothetical protein
MSEECTETWKISPLRRMWRQMRPRRVSGCAVRATESISATSSGGRISSSVMPLNSSRL